MKWDASIDEFTEASLHDKQIDSLARRVTITPDAALVDRATITLHRRQGKPLVGAFGPSAWFAPYAPVRAQYRRKFDRLAVRLAPDRREELWRHVASLPQQQSVRAFCRRLAELMDLD